MGNAKGSKKNSYWAKFRFEVVKNVSGGKQKFHWRAIACNGRIVCSSETYTSVKGPDNTIKSLIDAIKNDQFKIDDKLVVVGKEKPTKG